MEVAKSQSTKAKITPYIESGMISWYEDEVGQILLDTSYELYSGNRTGPENAWTLDLAFNLPAYMDWQGIYWNTCYYPFLLRKNQFCATAAFANGSCPYNTTSVPLGLNFMTFVSRANQTIEVYVNGKLSETLKRNNNNMVEFKTFCHKLEKANYVNVFSLRVYSRALEDNEIWHNYIIDKARFGI